MLKINIRPSTVLRYNQLIIRSFGDTVKSGSKINVKPISKDTKPPPPLQVTGLSSKCVKPNSGPVGPGASVNGDYKVPEYFCYDKMSYAEAEIEMAKYRLPQPSAV